MALTAVQVDMYLNRIRLPEDVKTMLSDGPEGTDALKALTTLQQYHMASVPYENLDLHYSTHRVLPQDTESVFNRVVLQKRGGTCIQVNLLFAELLRSIGFNAYCTGGRLNSAASISATSKVDTSRANFGAWAHVHTLVTIQQQKYLVETNFNQHGSPFPVPLVENEVVYDIWPRQRRMIYSSVPLGGYSDPKQMWWRMQVRQTVDDHWMDVYCFSENEWIALDFELLSAGISMLGGGWFKTLVVCFRILLENEVPVGYRLIWGDELRESYKGTTNVIQKFLSEYDRVAALEEEYGIILTEEEQEAIQGTSTEIVQQSFDYYS